jgi:putative alpha-1,2-mannosidase
VLRSSDLLSLKLTAHSLLIDAYDKGSYIKVIPGQNKIVGYSTKYAAGQLTNFKNYFVIYVDKAFTLSRTYNITDEERTGRNGARGRVEAASLNGGLETTADHALAAIGFKTRAGETVNLRVASSFISIEQAELNLKREIGTAKASTLPLQKAEQYGTKLWAA